MNRDDFLNKNILGSEYWVNSENKSFIELCEGNMLMYNDWKFPTHIQETEYKDKVIKPINKYALYFYPKPELIKKNNCIVLRQKTHAEIWVEPKKNGIYILDRPWQRQFYPSKNIYNFEEDCFDMVLRFYMPWLIDVDQNFKINSVQGSPFKILNESVSFFKFNYKENKVDTQWIDFFVKKNSDYIDKYSNKIYGIIQLNTPMYDIIIEDSKTIERILLEYNQ
jgi:hypothetical protein